MDNIYGPIGLCICCGKGLLRVDYMIGSVNANMVSVDIIVSAIIVVIWEQRLITYDH